MKTELNEIAACGCHDKPHSDWMVSSKHSYCHAWQPETQ